MILAGSSATWAQAPAARKAATSAAASAAAALPTLRIVLLEDRQSPQWDRSRLERAYVGHSGGSARAGIEMAIDDESMALQEAKLRVQIEAIDVTDTAKLNALLAASANSKAAEWLVLMAQSTPNAITQTSEITAKTIAWPTVNLGAASDELRGKRCATNLLHALPADRMRADALAQVLAARRWSQVLLLVGNAPEDAARAQSAQASMARFGLKLAARKEFVQSGDPRQRAASNPLLLTAGSAYDVVWVVDSVGEFARALPMNTQWPRPVVGDAGVAALAWHTQFERFGAPQVSRRFFKLAKRAMVSQDWAAWVATRAAIAAAIEVGGDAVTPAIKNSAAAASSAARAARLLSAMLALEVDGSKGVSLQFRGWDGQLRQPMLLTDGAGVLATAPLEGILHQRNPLDSLGADEPERLCATPPAAAAKASSAAPERKK